MNPVYVIVFFEIFVVVVLVAVKFKKFFMHIVFRLTFYKCFYFFFSYSRVDGDEKFPLMKANFWRINFIDQPAVLVDQPSLAYNVRRAVFQLESLRRFAKFSCISHF